MRTHDDRRIDAELGAAGHAANAAIEALFKIADEVKRLNDGLEAGTYNIRTHHATCVAPPKGDYSVRQLEVMSTYLNRSIQTGALVLPEREVIES